MVHWGLLSTASCSNSSSHTAFSPSGLLESAPNPDRLMILEMAQHGCLVSVGVGAFIAGLTLLLRRHVQVTIE